MFSNRDGNRVARGCARQVSRDHGVHEWLVPPLVLVDLLAKDCNQNLI